jgi:PAS domain S-box-containing protein
MSDAYRVLIVDDDIAQAEMVREFLHISGFGSVDNVKSIHSLWGRLKEHKYDIVLLDYKLPDGTGLEVLEQLASRDYQLPVVMVTGQGDERIAAKAIQRGAADYLLKSGDYLITLPALIRKSIRAHQLKLSVQRSLEQIRYQALLLNNVRDAIVVWDMNGRITYWNPAATALFGWNAKERVGRPIKQFYLQVFTPPITLPKDADGSGQHIVRKTIDCNGKTIWVSSHVTALKDTEQSDELIGYMDVSHNITRRIEAEQALRESEARYRAIVEDYQTELIARFKSNGTLTFVNEVYCRYFSKSRDDLIGLNFLYFVPEDERSKLVQHLISFGKEKPVATIEHQVQLPGKGLRWLQRTDRAIYDDDGQIFEFQSVGRDITDRKRMEAQIQAAQAHLVQAARMATIGEMASGVAHQIYNPLTTIIADAQILLRKMSADHPGRESAEAIEQAGWRLQKVVQRLMDFSQPENESQTPVQINETIQSAMSMVNSHIEAAGCRLEADLGNELRPVIGNSRQLESLWVNLLLLARDGCVNGRGKLIQIISKTDTSDHIVINVIDDGDPIPTDQLGFIFEPNFIGQTIGRGTGLELSICREIVRQHNGQITAEVTPEHDTIIRITLPAEV